MKKKRIGEKRWAHGYDENIVNTCMKFSNNKKK